MKFAKKKNQKQNYVPLLTALLEFTMKPKVLSPLPFAYLVRQSCFPGYCLFRLKLATGLLHSKSRLYEGVLCHPSPFK